MRKISSFSLEKYVHDEPIIIYGASAYGEIAYWALEKMGLKPDYYMDRAAKRGIQNIPVIVPDEAIKMNNANYIIASVDAFLEIKEYLIECGCNNLFDMCELLKVDLDHVDLSNRARDVLHNKGRYFDTVEQDNDDSIIFSRIQFVVTEKCTLRCKDCSHLMQYYSRPEDIDIDACKGAFDLFLECVDTILELRILGGEPFINESFTELIKWYGNHPKIKSISIYTNGTIMPSEKVLECLSGTKVRVHISDYGINHEKLLKTANELKENNINVFIRDYENWLESGELKQNRATEAELKKRFQGCFERNSYSFFRGRLYHCARSAHGVHLGAIPEMLDESINFNVQGKSIDEFRKQIKSMQELNYIGACNYCEGPSFHGKTIAAGIQTKKILTFDKG